MAARIWTARQLVACLDKAEALRQSAMAQAIQYSQVQEAAACTAAGRAIVSDVLGALWSHPGGDSV